MPSFTGRRFFNVCASVLSSTVAKTSPGGYAKNSWPHRLRFHAQNHALGPHETDECR